MKIESHQMFEILDVKYCIGRLLKSFGKEDPYREGLVETPDRVTKAWEFWLSGYDQDPKDVLKVFEDGGENYDEMVFQGNITFFSTCEHHLVPFFGVAHIGYIPNSKIVGLSKLVRLVDIFARRLQVQERMTKQIADALSENLNPVGVGVVLRARHLCLESRGVQRIGSTTITSKLYGSMKEEPDCRAEFLQFVNTANSQLQSL